MITVWQGTLNSPLLKIILCMIPVSVVCLVLQAWSLRASQKDEDVLGRTRPKLFILFVVLLVLDFILAGVVISRLISGVFK